MVMHHCAAKLLRNRRKPQKRASHSPKRRIGVSNKSLLSLRQRYEFLNRKSDHDSVNLKPHSQEMDCRILFLLEMSVPISDGATLQKGGGEPSMDFVPLYEGSMKWADGHLKGLVGSWTSEVTTNICTFFPP
jgi:hypothetical protein